MYYKNKYYFSKTAKMEFVEKMQEINDFCNKNGIIASRNNDSYYFTIDGQHYRVSNHTVEASNNRAWVQNEYTGEYTQIREEYHPLGEEEDTIYITASKTRLIEIYNDLKDGYKLDRRGRRKKWKYIKHLNAKSQYLDEI